MRLSKRLWRGLATELVTFSILVASIVLLWRNNPILFLVMLIECPAVLALWHERHDLSMFLVLAVLGTLAEAVFVYFGVWQYANPTFWGIPLWFPLSFGTAGLIGQRLARTITAMWDVTSPPSLAD